MELQVDTTEQLNQDRAVGDHVRTSVRASALQDTLV